MFRCIFLRPQELNDTITDHDEGTKFSISNLDNNAWKIFATLLKIFFPQNGKLKQT